MSDIIILRSDFYSPINPENRQSHFTTDFINALDFSHGYEVGICEIIFPTNIKNIPEETKARRIMIAFSNNNFTRSYPLKNKILIPSRSFKNLKDFKTVLNEKILESNDAKTEEENLKIIRLYFKQNNIEIILPSIDMKNEHTSCISGKITIKDNQNLKLFETELYFIFSNFLNSMLGYKESEIKIPKTISKYKIDLYAQNHTLFIYTNIVEESYVSNIKAQVLRIFPLEKYDDKNMKSIIFNPIIFRPLRLQKFDSITIDIRDSSGNLVIFESGTVTITLMFRKSK